MKACNRAVSGFKQNAIIADSYARSQDTVKAWVAAIKSWENLIANSAGGGTINRMARERLALAKEGRELKGLRDDTDADPCPWCGKKAKVYLNGTYVDGWISFVECSDSLECGARGPTKRAPARSNDEWIVQDRAVEAWNTVAEKP